MKTMRNRRGSALCPALVLTAAVLLALPASAPAQDGRGAATAARCDPIDPARCLLPWPNDHFTVRDARSATGRRLALTRAMMPRRVGGATIEPGESHRLGG